jgi:N-acetylglutamate synthase-like GNAT family acetyltransferase
MDIKTFFSDKERNNIAFQIYSYIYTEPKLTRRSISYIKAMLRSNSVFVLCNKNNMVKAFIIKERLWQNFYEIKSLYIAPSYRGNGVAAKLITKAIANIDHRYLSVTFDQRIAKMLISYKFKTTTLLSLPGPLLFRYITTRRLSSVIKHLFKKRSILLIKDNQ